MSYSFFDDVDRMHRVLTVLALLSRCAQDCQDESEGDGMKRERSLLMLASLATNALDEVYGMSKVRILLQKQNNFILPCLLFYLLLYCCRIRRKSDPCYLLLVLLHDLTSPDLAHFFHNNGPKAMRRFSSINIPHIFCIQYSLINIKLPFWGVVVLHLFTVVVVPVSCTAEIRSSCIFVVSFIRKPRCLSTCSKPRNKAP